MRAPPLVKGERVESTKYFDSTAPLEERLRSLLQAYADAPAKSMCSAAQVAYNIRVCLGDVRRERESS